VVQWSNDGFQGGIQIVFATPPFIGGACGVWTFNLTSMTFFSLSSLIFSPQPSYFQNSLSIYFSFTFSPCSFDYYLFYLK
jgi:hypothetical protein